MKETWRKLFPDATSNLVEYKVDGINTFDSYVKAIETAKTSDHYIYILGWMLDIDFPLIGKANSNYGKKGETYFKGDKTLLKLLETATKKEKGVEVRILIWRNPLYIVENKQSIEALAKLPNTKVFIDDYTYGPEDAKKRIAQHELTIRELLKKITPILVNPAARIKEQYKDELDGLELSDIFNVILYYLDKKNVGSHHEKILIVKGEEGLISFCGGIDINQNRFRGLHDAACKVQGPEAHQILNKFIKRWKNHGEAKSITLKGSNDSKPLPLGPVIGEIVSAKVVGTFNSPDGKDRDRSVKEAYVKIIAEAQNYIYIEDQYLVNLDVAKALNKKIKEYFFKKLIIVIQDSRETKDILIPDKRRAAFYDAVLAGTTQEQKDRFSLFMINDDLAKSINRHSAVHSKILIVDDELAIIGSANVNQRSFTLDSETSLIIFNSTNKYYRDNFAYKLRQALWRDLVLKDSIFSQITWEEFVRNVNSGDRYSILRTYMNNIQDLDLRIYDHIKPLSVPLTYAVGEILDRNLSNTLLAAPILNNQLGISAIVDIIFDNIIDPEVK